MSERWNSNRLRLEVIKANDLTADEYEAQWGTIVTRTLQRGDAFLVYENIELGHPDVGVLWGCSWGSGDAQLTEAQYPVPPTRAPDLTGFPPMWRFQLKAEVHPA